MYRLLFDVLTAFSVILVYFLSQAYKKVLNLQISN
nr:MAG TPA: hypothetical protein [Caudoviricetes sp.]